MVFNQSRWQQGISWLDLSLSSSCQLLTTEYLGKMCPDSRLFVPCNPFGILCTVSDVAVLCAPWSTFFPSEHEVPGNFLNHGTNWITRMKRKSRKTPFLPKTRAIFAAHQFDLVWSTSTITPGWLGQEIMTRETHKLKNQISRQQNFMGEHSWIEMFNDKVSALHHQMCQCPHFMAQKSMTKKHCHAWMSSQDLLEIMSYSENWIPPVNQPDLQIFCMTMLPRTQRCVLLCNSSCPLNKHHVRTDFTWIKALIAPWSIVPYTSRSSVPHVT